jgi:hypothetical protein
LSTVWTMPRWGAPLTTAALSCACRPLDQAFADSAPFFPL